MCEMCALPLTPVHQHLLELEKRQVPARAMRARFCSTATLASAIDAFRAMSEHLADFVMDDQEWDSLLIPINLAFFVHSSTAKRMVAQYPSPGGAMESSLDLEYWNVIVERNPVLRKFEPDVEALLVNRIASRRGITAHRSISASGWLELFARTGAGCRAEPKCGARSTSSSASWTKSPEGTRA